MRLSQIVAVWNRSRVLIEKQERITEDEVRELLCLLEMMRASGHVRYSRPRMLRVSLLDPEASAWKRIDATRIIAPRCFLRFTGLTVDAFEFLAERLCAKLPRSRNHHLKRGKGRPPNLNYRGECFMPNSKV